MPEETMRDILLRRCMVEVREWGLLGGKGCGGIVRCEWEWGVRKVLCGCVLECVCENDWDWLVRV